MSVGNSRYLTIGPGGRKCNCCFPAPGSKDRRAQFRIAKRRAEREAAKEIELDILDGIELQKEIERDNASYFEEEAYYDSLDSDFYDDFDEIEKAFSKDYDDDDFLYDRFGDEDIFDRCYHCGAYADECMCDGGISR